MPEPCLICMQPTQQVVTMLDPVAHWMRSRIKLSFSWITVRFLTYWATIGAPNSSFLRVLWVIGIQIPACLHVRGRTHTHTHTHPHTQQSILSLGSHQPALTYTLYVCYCDLGCSGPKKYFSISLALGPHNKIQLRVSWRFADGVTVIVEDKYYFALQRGFVWWKCSDKRKDNLINLSNPSSQIVRL